MSWLLPAATGSVARRADRAGVGGATHLATPRSAHGGPRGAASAGATPATRNRGSVPWGSRIRRRLLRALRRAKRGVGGGAVSLPGQPLPLLFSTLLTKSAADRGLIRAVEGRSGPINAREGSANGESGCRGSTIAEGCRGAKEAHQPPDGIGHAERQPPHGPAGVSANTTEGRQPERMRRPPGQRAQRRSAAASSGASWRRRRRRPRARCRRG